MVFVGECDMDSSLQFIALAGTSAGGLHALKQLDDSFCTPRNTYLIVKKGFLELGLQAGIPSQVPSSGCFAQ